MKEIAGSVAVKIPRMVWIGLAGVIVLDTAVQLTWKSILLRVPDVLGLGDTLTATAAQPMFYVLLALFAAQFLNWILVLAKADLSYVQPITALSYVTVAGCSAIALEEQIGFLRTAGVALIVIGAWLISRTNHRTTAPAAGPQAEVSA
jgi:drug/metabolite transporter (DMT)-like permease